MPTLLIGSPGMKRVDRSTLQRFREVTASVRRAARVTQMRRRVPSVLGTACDTSPSTLTPRDDAPVTTGGLHVDVSEPNFREHRSQLATSVLLTLHGQEHNHVVSGDGEGTRLVIVVELLVFNEDAD